MVLIQNTQYTGHLPYQQNIQFLICTRSRMSVSFPVGPGRGPPLSSRGRENRARSFSANGRTAPKKKRAAQSRLCTALVRWTATKVAVATVGVYKRFASGLPRWVEGGRHADNDRYLRPGQPTYRWAVNVNHISTDGGSRRYSLEADTIADHCFVLDQLYHFYTRTGSLVT